MQLHVSIRIPVLRAWFICWTSVLCIPMFCLWQSNNNFLSCSLAENNSVGGFKRWSLAHLGFCLLSLQHVPRCQLVPHCRGDGQCFLLSCNILAGRQEVWPLVDLGCWGFVMPKLLTETGMFVQATLCGSSARCRLDVILPSHQNTRELSVN